MKYKVEATIWKDEYDVVCNSLVDARIIDKIVTEDWREVDPNSKEWIEVVNIFDGSVRREYDEEG